MLPSSKPKNTLFTYNFYQPVIDKTFFNSDPNNLVFSSGLFGGCLFSSNSTVSPLEEFDNTECHNSGPETPEIAAEIQEPEVEMGGNTENMQPEEGAVVGLPKAELKLIDVFSSYLTFLRRSFLQVAGRKRAKVITWSKGKPTVKQGDEFVEDVASDKVVPIGEYMPFDRSETVEDYIFNDIEFPCLFSPCIPHAFENRRVVRNKRDSIDDDDATDGFLAEQVRNVQGYVERMGNIFESKTGELAVQFPHVISAFETYRNLCYESLKQSYLAVECEDENLDEVEGSVSYATACLNTEVFRDGFLQLDDERFDDEDSLDGLSYKSFSDDEEGGVFVSPSSDSVRKGDIREETIMFPETQGVFVQIREHDRGDGEPWDGLGLAKDPVGLSLPQKGDVAFDEFQDYITNDIPSAVENEIFHDVKDDPDTKSADQLPKVMLKWLGHFWGVEEELSPSLENVSKFHHVFTPLKVAPTR